jgi:hypothetical protein
MKNVPLKSRMLAPMMNETKGVASIQKTKETNILPND